MKTKFYLAGGVCAASLALSMPLNAQLSPATTASPATSPEAAVTSPKPRRAPNAISWDGYGCRSDLENVYYRQADVQSHR